jgi:hypothetical protein
MSVDDVVARQDFKWLRIDAPGDRRVYKKGKRVGVVFDAKGRAFADQDAELLNEPIEFDAVITLPFSCDDWSAQLDPDAFQIAFYQGLVTIKGSEGLALNIDAALKGLP